MKGIGDRLQRYVLGLVCLALVSAGSLLAQGTSGTITGIVTDQTGAVVPNAGVTVLNQGTGVKQEMKTNNAGVYSFHSLIPGIYTVQVTASGFKNYENHDLTLSVDQVLGVDVKLEVGASTQTIEVTGAAPLVNTEEGRMSNLVTGSQVANMPLNGRNIYSLMQLAPGAINSTNIDKENTAGGVQTNINGARSNFNGFLFDGVANKGLSGGSDAQPSPDFVGEFRIQTNNFDAQYSNSAGSITDVSTKSGTNSFHGDAFEFFRNDALNARNFFDGSKKSEFRLNQFGGTIGGPIKKNKLFFFAGYEGERFRTQLPALYSSETQDYRNAVIATNPNSVAALAYQSYPGLSPTSGDTVDTTVLNNITNPGGDIGATLGMTYAGTTANPAVLSDQYLGYTDPCFLAQYVGVGSPAGVPGLPGVTWGNPQSVANQSAKLFGVTQAENSQIQTNIANGCPGMGLVAPGVQNGALSRSAIMNGLISGQALTQIDGVFYDGNQFVGRVDYAGEKDRIFGRVYSLYQTNPAIISGNFATNALIRGNNAPQTLSFPGASFSWVRNITPTIVNEFSFGYIRNQLTDSVPANQFGVPNIGFDTGQPSFGAYNGYPQYFIENVFDFRDMITMVKGRHTLKFGGEYKANQENSQFNVGRPSYGFYDQVYFASDLPYIEAAGVNPELFTGNPSHLDTNIRAWRNYELGFFGQDDFKVTPKLTLNLGLRWDFFSPHTEKYNQATKFVVGPGGNATERLASINCASYIPGQGCVYPAGDTQAPNGGFTPAQSLWPARYGDFAPRFGFAWDPRGDGKLSIRGGAAIAFEGSFYNALSNSRWNLPYYSFNEACPVACALPGLPTYGPTNASGQPTGATPTFTGSPNNVGIGPAGAGWQGNVQGWLSSNPNLAHLTGIVSPNYRLPYVEQFFLGVQRQLDAATVVEVNGVMTLGRHLFWAEDPNRVTGGIEATNPAINPSTPGVLNPCTGTYRFKTPYINPCFAILRTWETSANSSYQALQVSVNRKLSRGVAFTTNYTWSHSIDMRSTWHALTSGGSATDANATGEAGYSYDPTKLYLERGNSLFDVRNRFIAAIQWDLPWYKNKQGFAGKVLGGWQTNYILSLQTGFPFTVAASKDYNGDGIRSDRPNTPSFGNSKPMSPCDFEANCVSGLLAGQSFMSTLAGDFPNPAAGTIGNLGRNTFRGPGFAQLDFSLFKQIPVGSNEARYFQFRAEFFNLFNRTNLYPPTANLTSSTFGLATQAFDPREIQFGLKFFF